MPTAQTTPAGEALRAMLPEGSDPYATIDLACQTAFLARDGDVLPDMIELVKSDPERSAALIVALAALVDVDGRPSSMLAWLGTDSGREQETVRMRAATAEAGAEYEGVLADTLPPVTLESMREMAYLARLTGFRFPCGTPAAYRRHRKEGKPPCPRCTWAWWIYTNATAEERATLKTPPPGADRLPPARRESGPVRCGTVGGYDAHREFGEQACQDCLRAAAEVVGAMTRNPTSRRRQCGSHGGYNAHTKNNEDPCDPCSAAQTAYDAEQYDRRLARQGRVRVRGVKVEGTVHQMTVREGDRQHIAA